VVAHVSYHLVWQTLQVAEWDLRFVFQRVSLDKDMPGCVSCFSERVQDHLFQTLNRFPELAPFYLYCYFNIYSFVGYTSYIFLYLINFKSLLLEACSLTLAACCLWLAACSLWPEMRIEGQQLVLDHLRHINTSTNRMHANRTSVACIVLNSSIITNYSRNQYLFWMTTVLYTKI